MNWYKFLKTLKEIVEVIKTVWNEEPKKVSKDE